jgi:hypothetical protein
VLTIFAAPKPFEGLISGIQRNAILSWTRLVPACEVILLGEERGIAQFATEHRLRHLGEVERNEFGTPLVSSIFRQAEQAATWPTLAYVNADIILMPEFVAAIRCISFPRFLLVGRRWDVRLDQALDFDDPRWDARLRGDVQRRGKLNLPCAMDYFVYSRGLYQEVPPFAIGRFAWDNWLVYGARRQEAQVVDMTAAVTAVHQDHDHSQIAGFTARGRTSPEIRRNLKLCGAACNYSVADADWRLRPTGAGGTAPEWELVRNPGRHWARCRRALRRMGVRRPRFAFGSPRTVRITADAAPQAARRGHGRGAERSSLAG